MSSLTELRRDVIRWGARGGVIACAMNLLWLVCLIALTAMGDTATQVASRPWLFQIAVGACLVLTLAQIPILLGAVAAAWHPAPARALVGGCLYGLYVPINLVAYFSFGSLAPRVYAGGASGLDAAPFVAALVEIGGPLGVIGNLPFLGYGILGLAWIVLSLSFWGRSRLWTVTASLLMTAGVLSLGGAIGVFLDHQLLTAGCLLGGVVSLPALASFTIACLRESRSGVLSAASQACPTSAS